MMQNMHMAATFLGYPTMLLLGLLGLWAAHELAYDMYKTWRRFVYDRRQAKIADKEWDDIRASWRAEMRQNEDRNIPDNIGTDVVEYPTLEGLTHDDVYDYIKEINNERA